MAKKTNFALLLQFEDLIKELALSESRVRIASRVMRGRKRKTNWFNIETPNGYYTAQTIEQAQAISHSLLILRYPHARPEWSLSDARACLEASR